MSITRDEFRARLDERMRDLGFTERVIAENEALWPAARRLIALDDLHVETDPDRFLERAEILAGTLGTEVRAAVRSAFSRRDPPRSIVAQLALRLQQTRKDLRVSGYWMPNSVAELVACPPEAFAERLYRSFLWREPSAVERASVHGRLAAGETRLDVIATVASFPAAMSGSPFRVEGVVDVPALLDAADDTAFVDALYREICERTAQATETNGWVSALRGGMSRVDVLRRFVRLTAANAHNRVFVGMPREERHQRAPR